MGTRMLRSKSGWNPHVKLKVPSCSKGGWAVAGIFADGSVIPPRVVMFELYETSPPPGNNGGAVSGAAPCALATGTKNKTANDSNAHRPQCLRSGLRILKSSSNEDDSSSTLVRKPGAAGGVRLDPKR